jgi:hypothetical protein
MNDLQVSQAPGYEAKGAVANDLFCSTGFSLWGSVLASTKVHRLNRLRKKSVFVIPSEARDLLFFAKPKKKQIPRANPALRNDTS